ncbi:putative linoleate 13S-lipoxygenase [Helianthus annuus]|uniref:Lipoxygenase n=1 Tax=Helianthus annuus TaxID=4232 RepID=A0A251V7H1_HELAN|nr:probable linoleate 9S-lipoxygenase 5 [Helianthus annuus]KAF5813640.1 putative linoleate 13S-lipoxygenase [Helianthus annuus]KAJ0592371.1 putative linoleate 13S-lipoxygenase [Helianthus annuus]KAJ0599903.1 putative linoleate 13S-lipoxygenase [Helianthus annuus]KAJ0607357.1 putative linoleate 13S-lipoxygenase [Helianthus annuus]KAJ0767412.1 putative linoleate 13S-lipoxygenase [Helianthus annuus]
MADEGMRKRMKVEEKKVKGTLVLMDHHSISATFDELWGRRVSLRLISTGSGEVGKETYVKKWVQTVITPSTKGESTFELEFDWEDVVAPGAFLIINRHQKEFYLKTLTLTNLPDPDPLHFICNSWVYNEEHYNNRYRIFFSNQTYLPGKTPQGLLGYREEELNELRGDGTGKREEWDRVYDYDVYNDLSQPDKGAELVRPVFGGTIDRPYPRRCRTGRPPSNADPNTETRIGILHSLQIYVPKDERFSEVKMADVYAYGLKLVSQGLLPGFESVWDKISDEIVGGIEKISNHKFESVSSNKFNEFSSFQDVLNIYQGGLPVPKSSVLESLREKIPSEFIRELLRSDGEHLSKFPLPQVIKEDRSAWRTDEEFGRELLAGICPVVIRRLQEFPPSSELDPMKFGNQNSRITEDHIRDQMDGLSVWEAMTNNRLFILDHHDPLMPYLRGINETSTKTYATRTILFLQKNSTLKPIAIELSRPHPAGDEAGVISTVHTPASDGAKGTIWLLAKAYANVNDSGYHQLVCHWLHTHASIEPFIIATNRQLSVLHPIHKLLHPHFRDTMNINALSRQTLISAGGLLEKTVFPDKYSLAMSCNMYKKWDFTKQALPADLIDRGMAVEDSTSPHGVRLLIEDYPFAVDGLEIWSAIKSWVHDYVHIYYQDDEEIQNDNELKEWWKEVRTKGHGDLKNESWWPKMQTREELIQSCTIIIWVASALHAAVNFGQYPYGGYLPNRPATSRRFLPEPGTPDYEELEKNPEKAFLKTVTPQLQSILGISLIEVLSRHSADEVYLGERDTPEWTADKQALEAFERFGAHLRMIEKKIEEMNHDKKLMNRTGPAQMPYTLLYPSSEIGLTGRGIPNSVSI